MKRQLPRQAIEQQFFTPAIKRAPLSEIIRLGAQLMLQKAVELEVTQFLSREHYCRSGDKPGGMPHRPSVPRTSRETDPDNQPLGAIICRGEASIKSDPAIHE